MNRACSRCGRIHSDSFKCNAGRTYKDTDDRKLRRTSAWTRKSKAVRGEVLFCEVCRENGRYTYNDLEVHHIVKLTEDPHGLLDDNNLIVLCVEHHKQADRGELSADYLRSLINKRQVAGGT